MVSMLRELTIFLFLSANAWSSSEKIGGSNKTDDIKRALDDVADMERDLFRFYKQWDTLSSRLASQGTGWALESCAKDHTSECTPEKKEALSRCISSESKQIHDQVVDIYDKKVRQPWQREFDELKTILRNPSTHTMDQVNETVWTVHANTYSENSVRYKFYNELVSFQVPFATPNVYPIDQVYKLCLKRTFPK